jgi:hypothetical protein
MASSGMLRRVALVIADVSGELSAPFMEALSSSETSVLTRATRRTSQKTPLFIVTAVKTSNFT